MKSLGYSDFSLKSKADKLLLDWQDALKTLNSTMNRISAKNKKILQEEMECTLRVLKKNESSLDPDDLGDVVSGFLFPSDLAL